MKDVRVQKYIKIWFRVKTNSTYKDVTKQDNIGGKKSIRSVGEISRRISGKS